ncbi:hypothetical protein HHL22_06790 [Hymenobacter sp. RP-2-7]|uniref:Uncharacterized protein n=1 Tax=Hymenobacter polaris TaxID=2682546 RepID=A0A7Y0AD64_9BACT|nr:hypothetical protein [Hymenobacter polaris]NML64910.1 hypothetical protein [Hymenobacter polaris]
MKTVQYSEFWYATILGLANCVAVVPAGFFSWQAFGERGHQAGLSWGAATLLLLFQMLAVSCVGWELLLLKMRRLEPAVSETSPLIIFCVGVVALVLVAGLVSWMNQ